MYYVIRPFDLIKVNKNNFNFELIFIILCYPILVNKLKKFKNLMDLTNKSLVKQKTKNGSKMNNPLYDKLFGVHSENDDTFLYLLDGQIITYRQFLAKTRKIANTFIEIGLQPGDCVAIQVKKSPEMLNIYAACAQAGLVFLPLNPSYTVDEVIYFIEDSEARLIICDEKNREALAVICQRLRLKIETLNSNSTGSIIDKASSSIENFNTVTRSKDDLAALLYTSGTTGKSKGAMLTQTNLLSNGNTLIGEWEFNKDDILLHALPLFHTHGLFVATNVVLAAGASMIFLPQFDLDNIIDELPKASAMMGVPTFYTRLLDDKRFNRQLVNHMRLFVSGSAPLLSETHIQFEKLTGHKILERYGMTETNMNTSNPYHGERRAGTVGLPLPGVEVKITEPKTGKTLSINEIGQIEVRGPNVFVGYWKLPKKTKAELRENGFFITGDLGKIDEDGYIHIVGRDKDLIISGGYNIYPKELEIFFDDKLGVLESAVIGVPHPDFGETPIAIIVSLEDVLPDLVEIENDIKKSIAKYKHPKKIIIVDELPRNAMGKVQKNVLRNNYNSLFIG
jgi:malonyl-CoA/methylmalonyl-CoA synthetase